MWALPFPIHVSSLGESIVVEAGSGSSSMTSCGQLTSVLSFYKDQKIEEQAVTKKVVTKEEFQGE